LESKFKNIDIIKIDSIDDIPLIKEDWITILRNSGNTNVYADPHFFTAAFEFRAKDGKPNIVLFKKNDIPIGIILGWFSKIKVSYKIGYLKLPSIPMKSLNLEIDSLITDGNIDSKKIISDYLKEMILEKEVDVIYAHHMSERNSFFGSMKTGLELRNRCVYQKSVMWVSKIRCEKCGKQEKLHSTRTNAKLRSRGKKLEKVFNGDVKIRQFNDKQGLHYFIENASKITNQNYYSGLKIGITNNDFWINFLTRLANLKFLRAYLLTSKNIPIAYSFGIVFKDTYYGYSTAYNSDFRDYSPGTYLLRKINKLLFEEKINYVHYGYGDADYKRMFGTESYEEGIIKIYSKGIKGRLAGSLDIVITHLNEFINNFLVKIGFKNKIKKIWRNFLAYKSV
jgi:hypothetical protein